MIDLPYIYGDAEYDFVILGNPVPVSILAESSDDSVTYAIPVPKQ